MIKRDYDNLSKLFFRCDEGIFLRYSSQRKSYRCLNMRFDKIVESENVNVDGENPGRIKMKTNDQASITSYIDKEKDNEEDNAEEEEEEEEYCEEYNAEEEEEEEVPRQDTKTPSRYVQKNHLEELTLGENNKGAKQEDN